MNAGEATPGGRGPLGLCSLASPLPTLRPQTIQGETKWGKPLTPWSVDCYFLRREWPSGDVSKTRIEKPRHQGTRGPCPRELHPDGSTGPSEMSCQVALNGTCKKWPAPLCPSRARGGSVSTAFPFYNPRRPPGGCKAPFPGLVINGGG